MDIFDKVKSVVTGSSAKVTLDVIEPVFGKPFTINIKAKIGDEDLKIDGVFLEVKAIKLNIEKGSIGQRVGEKINDVVKKIDTGERVKRIYDDLRATQTFTMRMLIDDAQELEEEKEYLWTKEILLPPDGKASYITDKEAHKWQFLAELDTFGVNPTTDWITIDIPQKHEAIEK